MGPFGKGVLTGIGGTIAVGAVLVAAVPAAGPTTADGAGDEPLSPADVDYARGVAAAALMDTGSGEFRPVAGTRMAIGAAPGGDEAEVTLRVLRDNGQACGTVESARRGADGSILATCSSGDRYLVATERTVGPFALNCTAAKELLDLDAC